MNHHAPARYFPPASGRYEVSPGLRPLGTLFGNDEADQRVFQIDRDFSRFRANKLACRAEQFDKYVCQTSDFAPLAPAVARFLLDRLVAEHPAHFALQFGNLLTLNCALTGERLVFDAATLRLVESSGPFYRDAFDALCCQVCEDVAIVRVDPNGNDAVAALHLCAPSHWRAEDKIGKSFVATHAPVPGFERVSAAARSLVEAMVRRGPWVRFGWGIEFDDRLNQHPEAPAKKPEGYFLRVERQVLWGLPDVNAVVFTIRVYVEDLGVAREQPDERAALLAALRSMSPATRRYKGLAERFEDVLGFLS